MAAKLHVFMDFYLLCNLKMLLPYICKYKVQENYATCTRLCKNTV